MMPKTCWVDMVKSTERMNLINPFRKSVGLITKLDKYVSLLICNWLIGKSVKSVYLIRQSENLLTCMSDLRTSQSELCTSEIYKQVNLKFVSLGTQGQDG